MNTTPPPESILSLLRKIKALASDPSAPAGERAAAESRLAALLRKHGVNESILHDQAEYEWCPTVNCQGEEIMVAHIVMMVTGVSKIGYSTSRPARQKKKFPETVTFKKLSRAAVYDCRDALTHFQPFWCAARRQRDAEIKRLRALIKKMPSDHATAFCSKLEIFDKSAFDAAQSPRALSDKEIEDALRRRRMERDIQGVPWSRHQLNHDDMLALPASAS